MKEKEPPLVLLAKSPKHPKEPDERETLVGHTRNVVDVADAIIVSLGIQFLKTMGLEKELQDKLLRSVLCGALIHDLGKANSQFQRALGTGRQLPQALRHEWISAWLILKFPELDNWMFGSPVNQLVRWAAMFAAIGHHLKIADGSAVSPRDGSGDAKIDIYLEHGDIYKCLQLIQEKLSLTDPPKLSGTYIDLMSHPLRELRRWFMDAKQWHENASLEERHFVALVKAVMIASDVAGSAVPKYMDHPQEWTKQVLTRFCTSEELGTIALTRLKGQAPRKFQQQVAASQSVVTFVNAGCGSGKTVAAYLWAAKNAAGRKLFFCYPTTGTASEGFRDYIIPAEMNADAALLHSRSQADLEDLFSTNDARDDELDNAVRIESLAAWDVPLILCTIDLVLGLIQNSRRSLFSFPAIANGAFVFDEIHQYDDRMFRALLRFLDAFCGAPVLLMTASLPKSRLEAIRSLLKMRNLDLEVIRGPDELELIPRYILNGPLEEPPWDLINETQEHKGKILWVANTVNRAISFAQAAKNRNLEPMIYHSRFRYCDRLKKHQAVIETFSKQSEPCLVVATQVCEVSLDLSADLLISDLAPIPALIQRMGRLNRRVTKENPGKPKPTVILDIDRIMPYRNDEFDLNRVIEWIKTFGHCDISQADLAHSYKQASNTVFNNYIDSAWLDSGPFGAQAPLREASVTFPVIREEDVASCTDQEKRPIMNKIVRYSIPMMLGPVINEFTGWRRLGFSFVAPKGRIEYSEDWGAKWAKQK